MMKAEQFPAEDSREAELTHEQEEILYLKARVEELEKENDELKELAYVDRLTGVLNRHGFDEIMKTLTAQRQRKENGDAPKPVAVMIVDIDNFKKINDEKSHDEGDRVLSEAGRFLKDSVRRGDVVARWGGEEFVIIFYNANAQDVFNKYYDKESKVSRVPFNEATFSGGITSLHDDEDIKAAITRADKALYASKRTGKDHLLITEDPEKDLPDLGDKAKE